MKVALPSRGDMVDGHFGHCEHFTIFEIDDNKRIVGESVLSPPPGCGCKSGVAGDLRDLGVEVLLAGNMGQGAVNVLAGNGISVVRGCSGKLREVTEKWLAGSVGDSGAVCESHGDCGSHHHD